MTPASTSEISAPRRYDVARFFADGNRLLSASIDASQARGVTVQRLPIQSTGPTRSLAFQAVLPLASLARRQHDAGPHDIIGGGDQPAGNHHGARFIGAGGQEPDPSTRVVPSAIDRFICVWKHELIPRTPISTRSRSTNTRRRELAAIRGRVSWRGYVRSRVKKRHVLTPGVGQLYGHRNGIGQSARSLDQTFEQNSPQQAFQRDVPVFNISIELWLYPRLAKAHPYG